MLSKQTIDNLVNYQQHYAEHGWVRMTNYFDEEVIRGFSQAISTLKDDVQKWQLATLVQGQPFKACVNKYLGQPPQVRSHFIAELLRYAQQNDFQYFYEFIRVVSEKDQAPVECQGMSEVMSSESHLQTLKDLVKDQSITQIDTQLTGYKSGHFLKRHSDDGYKAARTRKVAYVLSMSDQWQADWGGLLHLQNDQNQIEQTFVPTYNTMILFTVPTSHFVSQVTNFCPNTRFSLTGWLWE